MRKDEFYVRRRPFLCNLKRRQKKNVQNKLVDGATVRQISRSTLQLPQKWNQIQWNDAKIMRMSWIMPQACCTGLLCMFWGRPRGIRQSHKYFTDHKKASELEAMSITIVSLYIRSFICLDSQCLMARKINWFASFFPLLAPHSHLIFATVLTVMANDLKNSFGALKCGAWKCVSRSSAHLMSQSRAKKPTSDFMQCRKSP